jgi:GntR family histidine utilization transcriptional repressor
MLDRIRSGKLAYGALLPCEKELASEFGCARLTVHRALRELADEGYLERRRRAGTRVAERASLGLHLSVPRVDDEIIARGKVYRYERLDRQVAPPPESVADTFGLPKGTAALHIVCQHWADDRVFQLEDRWINPEVVPDALDQPFMHLGPNRWLLQNVPFSDVTHEIAAVAAHGSVAEWMGVAPASPLLQIRRRTVWQGRCVTLATLSHPGDQFTLASHPQS